MARLLHQSERWETNQRQNRSDNQTSRTEERKGDEILPGLYTTSVKIHQQLIEEDRSNEETVKKGCSMGLDNRNRRGFQKVEEGNHGSPKRDSYITTDACNTGLGATLWQKEGVVIRPVAFAS